jgi:hypothetical protein
MHERTEQLRQLMQSNNLSCAEVGKLLGKSPQTVRIWRCHSDNKVISQELLQLLRYKVQERAQ